MSVLLQAMFASLCMVCKAGRQWSENHFSGNWRSAVGGLGSHTTSLSSSHFRSCPALHPHPMLTALMATASTMR